MASMTQPLDAYLAQLSSIQTHDASARLDLIAVPTLVVAGEQDILIRCASPGDCTTGSPSRSGPP